MVIFPEKEIKSWLIKEYVDINPDYVIPIGNRIFHLIYILREKYGEFDELCKKIIDINAIQYLNLNNKSIMFIDEETEYDRKFLYDVFPFFEKIEPKSVTCFTVFLNNNKRSIRRRKKEISKFRDKYPKSGKYTLALEEIKSYKSYVDSKKFHSCIFAFRDFIKHKLNQPYNRDATKFYVTFDSMTNNLKSELSKYGPVISYRDSAFSLIPYYFNVEKYKDLNGIKIIEEGFPKLRFFKIGTQSMIVSPMAYIPIEFSSDFVKPDFGSEIKQHTLLCKMLKAWQKSAKSWLNESSYLYSLYDLLVFWLDIELFKSFIPVFESIAPTFQFKLDEDFCLSHYGGDFGKKIIKIIYDDLSDYLKLTELEEVNYKINASHIEADLATLLSIKAACLETYPPDGEEVESRVGLTFSGIQKRLKLDPFSISICIDLLCDNACLKPFDGLEKPLRMNRFYNTDVEEFIGFFIKLLRKAEVAGIPMGKTNINKFTAFLSYFVLPFNDRIEGEIEVREAPQGKVAHVVFDDIHFDKKLEQLFTDFSKYSDVFEFDRGVYKVKDDAFKAEFEFQEHMTIIENESVFDTYTNIIFSIYKQLQDYISKHPELVDSYGNRRTIYDAFPGFIELVGNEYPEGGLKIVGVLTKRALSYFNEYKASTNDRCKTEANRLIANSIPHKILMYQQFSDAYIYCYKYLSTPYDSNMGSIWQNMCVFPSSSLILELCDKIVTYIRSNLNTNIDRIKVIENNVEKYLNFMIKCSSTKNSEIQLFQKGSSETYYVVSVDLKNSTKLDELYDLRWKKIKKYSRILMIRWAQVYNAKRIDIPGDEIILAFSDFDSARSFAAGCCIHLTEILGTVNRCETFKNQETGSYDLETGCYVRITKGLITVDQLGVCDSSELNKMCKYLPKKVGKIVIDASTIDVNTYFPEIETVMGSIPHCILDPCDEFREMILSQFE